MTGLPSDSPAKMAASTSRIRRAAERAVTAYAGYYNYHRLHGELGWHTPAQRFDGTPFTDRGFENIPGVSELLSELLAAA